jgi:hypothetical protein
LLLRDLRGLRYLSPRATLRHGTAGPGPRLELL